MDLENTILLQIQQNLDALQKQIDTMNMKSIEPEIEVPNLQSIDLRYKIKEKSSELMQLMKELISSDEAGLCMSAVLSVGGAEYGDINETSFYYIDSPEKIEKIDAKGLANAVEAFSSPKRITILKTLLSKKLLSSNELTMKTGCIGGQLYHHLSILEAAKIICKSNELYTLTDYGRNITNQIFGIVFGESL